MRRIGFRAAISMIALSAVAAASPVGSPGATGRPLGIARAERAARDAVLAHPTYRQITARRTGLVTRSCRRVPALGVRCSFYVVAPSPCALGGDPGGVCAQALWERRWLVEVTRRREKVVARIVRISSGPAASTPNRA